MKDCIIILSGGMDSTTLLYEYQDRILKAISFHYGSNHNDKEIPLAEYHCQKLGIPHHTIRLDFIKEYLHSSLIEGDDAIPEGNYDEENMKSTVVPFRNGIMLSIATGIADDVKAKYVMMANHGGDHTIYPDCTPSFVENMSKAMSAGTYQNITLLAPYTNLTKVDIARRGAQLGIDYSQTWSCYRGGEIHCGKCGTCRERKEALQLAGIKDNTPYQH